MRIPSLKREIDAGVPEAEARLAEGAVFPCDPLELITFYS